MKMTRQSFFFLLLFLFLLGPAHPKQKLQLHLASTTRVLLPNGLRLLVRETEHTNNVAIYLTLGSGQLTENENQAGITHLLQSYLMDIPVDSYHDAATAIEAQGGVAQASSGPDSSYFSFVVSPHDFPYALKVLSYLTHQRQINSTQFEEVKKNVLEEIKNSAEQSFQALYGIFLQEFYTFHPYRTPVLGTLATIKDLKPDDLLHYYEAYHVPNNMVISVVGPVDTDRVIHLINHYFSDLPKKSLRSLNIYYQPVLSEEKQIQLTESGNIAWLFLGFSAPELRSEDYASMQVINSVLGSSMSSRIWLSLRENRGLSYDLGSQYSAREGPSHFIIYVATDPEHLDESKNQLLKQIQRIRRESLTQEELETVKQRIVGRFILSLETNEEEAKFLAWSELSEKGILFDQTYLSLLQNVTSEDVLRVAKKYLENYILISVR